MKISSWLKPLFLGTVVLMSGLTSGCMCTPLLYKPTYDPTRFIMSLKVPDKIETLSNIARGDMLSSKDWTIDRFERRARPRKGAFAESVSVEKRTPATRTITEYGFWLGIDEEPARSGLKSGPLDEFVPPFRVWESGDRAYVMTHVWQERSRDGNPWGICMQTGSYHGLVDLRFRNLQVHIVVSTNKENIQNSLKEAVEGLPDLLNSEWTIMKQDQPADGSR